MDSSGTIERAGGAGGIRTKSLKFLFSMLFYFPFKADPNASPNRNIRREWRNLAIFEGHSEVDFGVLVIQDSSRSRGVAQTATRNQRAVTSIGDYVKPVRPKFRNPPLVERAITVVFEKIDGFSLGDFGLFWDIIRDEFPVSEAVAATPVDLERFDIFTPVQPLVELIPADALPRGYFRNSDAGELLQVQADRFTFNWLKTGSDHCYPHSEVTFARFWAFYAQFEAFLRSRELGGIKIIQCELTNVNAIPVSDVGETFADVATVLKMPEWRPDTEMICLEGQVAGARHLMLNDAGEAIGRVHSMGQPAMRVSDNERTFRLDIVARGAPLGEGLSGARGFFDEAVSAINSVFLAITTQAGRQFWGEYDGDRV